MNTLKKIYLLLVILLLSYSNQIQACKYKVELYDLNWNGWMGSKLSILVGTDTVLKDATLSIWYGPETYIFDVNSIDSIRVVFTPGTSPVTNFFKLYNAQEELIYIGGSETGNVQPKTETIQTQSDCPLHDLKLSALTSPVFGCGLNSSVPIKISIKNYGASSESNFNVSYTVNDGLTWTTEQVAVTVLSGETLDYIFIQQANMACNLYCLIAAILACCIKI